MKFFSDSEKQIDESEKAVSESQKKSKNLNSEEYFLQFFHFILYRYYDEIDRKSWIFLLLKMEREKSLNKNFPFLRNRKKRRQHNGRFFFFSVLK